MTHGFARTAATSNCLPRTEYTRGYSANRPCATRPHQYPPEMLMPENLPPIGRKRAAVAMLKFGWAADRTGTLLAFVLFGSQAATQSLFAYWLKLLIDGLRPINVAQLVTA